MKTGIKNGISIYGNFRNRQTMEWAGQGVVEFNAAGEATIVDCAANLEDGAYEEIELQLHDGRTEGIVECRGITYGWSLED